MGYSEFKPMQPCAPELLEKSAATDHTVCVCVCVCVCMT